MTRLQTTVIPAYEQRGPWGKSDFRGNVSGHLVNDLLDTYAPKNLLDVMEGSGTSRDVARGRELPYLGYDLAQGHDIMDAATRKRIQESVDLLTEGVGMDFVFWHPPYWQMVMYSNDPRDFSKMAYPIYLVKMREALRHQAKYLAAGGRIAILLGDYRKGSRYYWIIRDFLTEGALSAAGVQLEIMFVREQFNVQSNNTEYADSTVRLMHEYIAVVRKPFPREVPEAVQS